MKKTIISISIASTMISYAADFNVVIKKEEGFTSVPIPLYTDTGNERCKTFSPENNEYYKDTEFSQIQSDCEKEQSSSEGQTRWLPISETKTETSFGTLVLNDCKDIKANDHDRGNGIYIVNYNSIEEDVYCNMDINGGGWTLTAVKANDNNDYWTWNNRSKLRDGSVYGSVNSLSNDYQGNAWNSLSADQLLLTPMDESKGLIYNSVLSNQPLKSIYPNSNIMSSTFTADEIIGSWWKETGSTNNCDNGVFNMRTMTPDSDSHQWNEPSVGFVWMSQNNDKSSCWDDTFGGLSSGISGQENKERSWSHGSAFYKNNYASSGGMFVFVR